MNKINKGDEMDDFKYVTECYNICKKCDFDSPFAFGAFYHIKHKHPNSKIGKKEYLFVFKYNLIFRFLMCCFILIMRIIGSTLWLITYPFWALHELID